MDNIIEKYSELKEELDGRNPFVKYALLKEELDNKDPLKRYAHIKKELDYIKKENVKKLEEDNKKREENTLGAMESLFHSLGGEESDIENQSIIVDEQPQELVSEEEVVNVEKIDIQEEQPINGFKSVVDVISKQEARKEKLQEQPSDPVSTRIEKLEKHIQKIAFAGPGSGEVRLLNLDDVNTTNLANDKILKYQSSSGKFIFADAATGSGHTIQNAGSDLTSRDNLNFDGTYVIATDDSGNDQSDITLSSALQSWHTKARPSGVVIGTTDSQTLTNKTLTSPVLNTGVSGTAVLDEDNMASDSATKLASQQSIKAYVDSQTHEAGDITSVVAGTGLTGGATSGAATLNVIGGTGITANADDIAVDATITTLTGSQTLTNKTLTSAILNTSISGTAISVTSGSTSITTALDDIAINTQILDTPVGYISLVISGTTYKLPYYSA